jgi:SAM-dependent methyltransferase
MMSLSALYWGWADHTDDPAYERRIDEALADVRRRLIDGGFAGLEPTPGHLLRMVDVEFGRADSGVQRLRRDRWRFKLDTLLDMLRPGQTVIDCGSGFGTEVIAFALAGARVTAVDLFPAYLELLRRRVALYGELFGIPLSERVDTVAAHLPDYEPEQRFDYAWSNESIEHIAPLERFLGRLPGWLNPGGAAVICNDNALNPIRLAVTMRARRSFRARYATRDTVEGTQVPYGDEMIRSAVSTGRLLREAGFASVETRMLSVVPSQLVRGDRSEAAARRLERVASVPGLRLLVGGDYVAVARPRAASV